MCLGVPPSPVYKGAGEGAAGQEEGAPGGVLLPPGVGFPPFLVGIGFGKGERGEREGRGGAAPPLLVLFGLGGEGARGLPWLALLFLLGNVVISKNFLRTRKIMVMHSNMGRV